MSDESGFELRDHQLAQAFRRENGDRVAPGKWCHWSAPSRHRGAASRPARAWVEVLVARFDTLAAESIEAVFQAVLAAATQDGDMAAAKLLIDRIIPSRRGAP